MKTTLICCTLLGTLAIGATALAETTDETPPPAETTDETPPPAETTDETPAPAETTDETPSPAETTDESPPPAETTHIVQPPLEETAGEPLVPPADTADEGQPPPAEADGDGDRVSGRRPGFGLWVGGLVTGLVGFGLAIPGIALVLSEECAESSCPGPIALVAVGAAAFIAGIIMVTVGRRRMRRAQALPSFMTDEASRQLLAFGMSRLE